LFAGKSEITEGCSDLREIGDSSDLPGISDVRLSRRYGSDAAGAAGTAVATVDGRHFGAANCGVAESVLRLLRNFGTSVLLWSIVDCRRLAQHPCSFSRSLCESRPAADGSAICGHQSRRLRWRRRFRAADFGAASVSGGSWRKRGAQTIMGGGVGGAGWRRSATCSRLDPGRPKLAIGGPGSGAAEAGDRRGAQSWRDRPSCFGGLPRNGARSGRKWRMGLGRGGRSSRALSGRIGESCFWAASPNWRGGRRYALAVWRAISEKAGGRGETSPKFEAGRQTPMIFAAWAAPAGRSKLLGGARRGLGAESGAALGESGPAGRRGRKVGGKRGTALGRRPGAALAERAKGPMLAGVWGRGRR
jgi:hypothetical protein